jgi:hypothetical protein
MADNKTIPPDMRAQLDKFDAAADKLILSIGRALDAQEPPPIVYHYTRDAGLRGILETGKLWVTDIFNLNDPSELSHGFSHATSILKARASDGHRATKVFAQAFEKIGTEGGLQASAHFFVCSFSSCADDLGQWRAYADNGRGYTLGFVTKMLEIEFARASELPNFNNSTFPLIYDDAQLLAIHRQLIDMMFHLITLPSGRNLAPDVMADYMADLSVLLAMHVARSALFYKHEAYSNEKEYRFLQLHRADGSLPQVKFRSRPYSLVRYREFDWRGVAPQALKRIITGPSADQQRSIQFAKDCLREFHSGPVEISVSTIPYRAA